MNMASKKTWQEKLNSGEKPRIVDDPRGRGKMLIPTPLLVDGLVRQILPGELVTMEQIRGRLASDFQADFT
jgi:hypothetical protein